MSKQPETERPELRAKLLAAATKQFLQRPYAEVRVEDIAVDAGVAKGLAFYYFESKRGLYVAVVGGLLEQLVERTRPDPSLRPREREVAAVGNFVSWAAEVEGVELILTDWAGGDAQLNAIFRRALENLIGQTIAGMSDMPGGPGAEDALPSSVLSRSIWGWMAFARVVTADWLRARDLEQDQLRDLLVGALDGVVAAARAAATAER